MKIKICTSADIHIGYTTYGTIDPQTGLNTRVLNALNSLDEMINYCINNSIEYLIIAGDAYKNNMPSPTLQKEFDKRIKRAADNNIKIYIMDGNHDVSMLKTANSALKTFDTLGVKNVFHSKNLKLYDIGDLQILMMPTYCNQELTEQILSKPLEKPTLVVMHGTIKGAMLNDWLIEQNELAIDIDTLKKDNIIGVVLGHLHKHQILNKDPLIYYTGSLQRIDFTEENQEKGFVVLTYDTDNKNLDYEFIEVPSQTFHTIKLDLTNSEDEMIELFNEFENRKNKLNNSIVRLILNVNSSNKIEDNILIKKLKEYNIYHLASIQKNVVKNDIVKNKEITENITEEKALKMYFKDNKNADKIINEGLRMIQKLQNDNLI